LEISIALDRSRAHVEVAALYSLTRKHCAELVRESGLHVESVHYTGDDTADHETPLTDGELFAKLKRLVNKSGH
jgi:hypothetical protein